ncbi:MAG: ATP-binding cassette domain-containing protein [Christensenellaceae bacterium]
MQTASRRQWKKIVMANELNSPIVDLFWNLGTLLIYAVSIWAVAAGKWSMQTGTVIAFLNYMSLCASPFMQLSSILQNLSQVSANLERVFETIDEQNPITEKNDAKELANVRGEVDFEKVTFGYEAGINVLENFDLHVAAGETIALVGPTGAGKTTVINLITRFYDPASGCVKIDGINVRDVTLGSLRSRVGVLMQDPFIFMHDYRNIITAARGDGRIIARRNAFTPIAWRSGTPTDFTPRRRREAKACPQGKSS